MTSSTQLGIAAGGGLKMPFLEQFALRLQGLLGRDFETDERVGPTTIQAVAGLSFSIP